MENCLHFSFPGVFVLVKPWFDGLVVMEICFSYFYHLFYRGIQSIETAIGRSMVTIIENFVTFLFCFAIAFYVNWKLAAVTGSLLPPMFLFAFIIGKVLYCMHTHTHT